MRFILHQYINPNSCCVSYNFGKMMLYYLGEKIHLSGINELEYFMPEEFGKQDFNYKLEALILWSEGENKHMLEERLKEIKIYNRTKNKNSRMIISYNMTKKSIEKHFEAHIEQQFDGLEKLLGLKSFRGLIDNEKVNFYHLDLNQSFNLNAEHTSLIDVLSLQLPPEEGECPILFLSNDDGFGNTNLDLTIYEVQSKESALSGNIYLADVFQFPGITSVPNAMMKAIAAEFSKEAKSVKDQLHLWAKTCYENPNTSNGHQYFKENIAPIIEEKRRLGFEIHSMQEIVKISKPNLTFHLQFGEMPIEKIWELMYAKENCTEEEYNTLLELKKEQSPRYDGRWPVVFFKTDFKEIYLSKKEDIPTLQPRKTLDID